MSNATIDREYSSPAGAAPSTHASGVSWAAILAGAAGAAALSLILMVLGSGLGFAAVSPWSQEGAGATTLGVSSILYLTLTAIIASGLGGYLAGRLRARWLGTPRDEVHFRDTAHGFLAWAIATLVTAAMLSSAIGSIVGGAAKAGAAVTGAVGSAAVAGGAAAAARSGPDAGNGPSMGYDLDSLFRRDPSAAPAADAGTQPAPTGEVARIFAQSLKTGTLTPEDQRYVGQLVAQRTGMSPDDANKRVGDVYARVKQQADEAATKAKEAVDTARKAASYGSLWLFITLLIGAFCASFAATFGGRQRDL